MNRILMAGASAIMVTSVAAGGLLLAGPAGASTTSAASMTAPATCKTTHHNYPFPRQATTYKAGPAGSVTIAPVNSGTIKVASVQRAPGYRAFVDSRSGSSVDVYFRGHARHIKFEAEINDAGGLTINLSGCWSN